MKNINEFLKNILIFSNLNEEQYKLISKICKLKKYKKKEIIFNEGEDAKGFYIIYSGKVKIYKVSFEGKEQILHIFGKYQIFGEVPVFSNFPFPATAIAIENSEIIFISKKEFIALLEKNPKISLNFIAVLSKRLHTFTNIIEGLSLKEIPGRLASYILYLKKDDSNIVSLNITKSQLASILGTIPETLSRVLTKMSQQNIIELQGKKILIKDIDRLEDISYGYEKL